MEILEAEERTTVLLQPLVEVWDASVKATHAFLSDDKWTRIRTYVPQAHKEVAHLVITADGTRHPVGFMGVEDDTLACCLSRPANTARG